MTEKHSPLLPCPFCGGSARTHQNQTAKALWRVICDNCDAGPHGSFGESLAINAWNTRAVNGLPEAIAALEEIAKQATSAEMQASVDADCAASEYAAQWHATAELADFRGGYDECVVRARAALTKLKG